MDRCSPWWSGNSARNCTSRSAPHPWIGRRRYATASATGVQRGHRADPHLRRTQFSIAAAGVRRGRASPGPLILLPGFASLLALAAFYPGILSEPLPIFVVLARIANPTLSLCVQIVILGAFIKTGVGLLHGLNERVARAASDRGVTLPQLWRPAAGARHHGHCRVRGFFGRHHQFDRPRLPIQLLFLPADLLLPLDAAGTLARSLGAAPRAAAAAQS